MIFYATFFVLLCLICRSCKEGGGRGSNTMVTVNQVVAKRFQDRKIWDINDGVILQQISMQITWLQDMKDSTTLLNNDLGITITLAEIWE